MTGQQLLQDDILEDVPSEQSMILLGFLPQEQGIFARQMHVNRRVQDVCLDEIMLCL